VIQWEIEIGGMATFSDCEFTIPVDVRALAEPSQESTGTPIGNVAAAGETAAGRDNSGGSNVSGGGSGEVGGHFASSIDHFLISQRLRLMKADNERLRGAKDAPALIPKTVPASRCNSVWSSTAQTAETNTAAPLVTEKRAPEAATAAAPAAQPTTMSNTAGALTGIHGTVSPSLPSNRTVRPPSNPQP